MSLLIKVSNGAKNRNRYNQVPHLTQDTNGKVTNSQKTPFYIDSRSTICLHDKMLKFIKTGDVVVSHRHQHATIANALIKTWSATTTFSIFKRWSCSAKYIVIDCKKCNFATKKDIFDCRRRFQWAHWQIIASSCDFHSCNDGSDELAHMQYRKGLLQQ